MAATSIVDVLDGVIEQLSVAWPEATLYAEEIRQGFAPPCFFVRLYPVAQRRLMDRRSRRTHNVLVQYYPLPDGDQPLRINRELHIIAEQLYDELLTIPLGSSSAAGTAMSHEIADGTLQFFVTYSFDVLQAKETGVPMAEIKQEVHVRYEQG